MARFKVLVIYVIALFACSGCGMKEHKNYAFTEPKLSLNTGVIHAKFRGTQENSDNETSVNHSPYELLLWFVTPSVQNHGICLVSLNSMVLKNSETGEYVKTLESSEVAFRESSDGAYVAYFSYKKLNILYADHDLEFKYYFSRDCGLDQLGASGNMSFKIKYSERNITFWDILMGV